MKTGVPGFTEQNDSRFSSASGKTTLPGFLPRGRHSPTNAPGALSNSVAQLWPSNSPPVMPAAL
jgi:hypothetical protein